MNSTDATDIPQDAFELDFEADSISGPPSPGGDLSREDRFVPGSDEDQEAPPCPEEEWVDEWADDSDAGYLMEQITEGEFLEIEERFSKIFSVYREESITSSPGCLPNGLSPERSLARLSLNDTSPHAGDAVSGCATETETSACSEKFVGELTLGGNTSNRKKKIGRRGNEQPPSVAEVPIGNTPAVAASPPCKDSTKASIDCDIGYEGMDSDLAAVEICYKDNSASEALAGKKRRKRNKNKRRKSSDVGDNQMPPTCPVTKCDKINLPIANNESNSAALLTSPVEPKPAKGGKNRRKTAVAAAEQKVHTPPNSPVMNNIVIEMPRTPPSSPVVTSGKKSGSRRKNKRKTDEGAPLLLEDDDMKTPQVLNTSAGSESKIPSAGGKSGASSRSKQKKKAVKPAPTPYDLTKGAFGNIASPNVLERSGGSIGNVGFSAGESKDHDHARSDVWGQKKYRGVDGDHYYFDLKVIFNPFRTGFEEDKDFNPPPGSVIVGRYEVCETLGQAAFSTAYQCLDLEAKGDEHPWVCLKVIKNSKDFFDQSLDEIKLLQYINSKGDPHENNVLRMIDFFYCKEHLFIVSELLRENLYDFGKFVRDSGNEPYFTLPRLKKIMHQVLSALVYIHSLGLIHCDIKPENIVIKSYSRCEVKLIDFGSSCFVTDHLTTYIQSRSYRAPEVILGIPYDFRIDIWSLGGVLAEMFTGYVLFQNDSIATMLARIAGILGPFPEVLMQNQVECSKYFVGGSNIVYECNDNGYFIVHPKKSIFRQRLHIYSEPSELNDTEEDLFVDFVEKMLDLDPYRRWNAVDALSHPWLHNVHEVNVAYSSSG